MLTFDYITLREFVNENREFLVGSRVQKIQQPTRRDFLFSLRNLGESKKLYININPSFYHICFTTSENIEKRGIVYPKKPPMFCMLLRKYIESAVIKDVRVPYYERILEIDLKSSNEFDENIDLTLAIEFMGKHSNIILYNQCTKIILGAGHNVGSEKSREREISGTIPYIYPPKQDKKDILRYTGELNYDYLNQEFLGISKSFEEFFKGVSLEKIKDYVEGSASISPAVEGDRYCVYGELLSEPVFYSSVTEMVDEYYSRIQERSIVNGLKQQLATIYSARYKKCSNSLKKINYQISKKDKAEVYKKYGDLILANMYQGEDYTKFINVVDWDTGENIKIDLSEELTLKENSQRYYKLYAKSKDSREKLESLSLALAQEKEYLEQVKYSIDICDDINGLKEILQELDDSKSEVKKFDTDAVESVNINGFVVYIGKNNRQNDLIVSKISRGEDIWFHTQNTTGSHILLKVTDNREVDDATIYECCKLAKKYSSASSSGKVGVIYTKRKYLKKPPASPLGYVTYKNEKEIVVE